MRKGELVVCPKCQIPLAQIINDISSYLPVSDTDLISLHPRLLIKAGHPPECPDCGNLWLVNRKLSTEYGWR